MKTNRTFILGVAIACTMMGVLTANGKNNSYDNMDAMVILQGRNTTSTQRVYSVASDGYTNIRSAASINSAIIGELRNGKGSATLMHVSGQWYKVNYNGIVGYVHKSQVKVVTAQQSTGSPALVSVASDGYTNIRRGPSTSDRIIGEIRNGKGSATIIGTSGKWYKVNYNGIVGYVHKSQVKVIR